VIELWTLSAEQLLAANDLGLVPWVPLARIDGPPEPVLRDVRKRIDAQAPPDTHDNLLAVTQVLTRLRYNEPQLLAIFGGRQAMIESPLIQEIMQETVVKTLQEAILQMLAARFGAVPPELTGRLNALHDEPLLRKLVRSAATCPDLKTFGEQLSTPD